MKSTLNYTMNPSSLPVPGVENEKLRGYFTILTLSIYICLKKMGRMHKDPGIIPIRKSQDYCLMSRPRVYVATWIPFIGPNLVATGFLQLRPGFFHASLISGRDLNCGCDLFGSVLLKS